VVLTFCAKMSPTCGAICYFLYSSGLFWPAPTGTFTCRSLLLPQMRLWVWRSCRNVLWFLVAGMVLDTPCTIILLHCNLSSIFLMWHVIADILLLNLLLSGEGWVLK
jgi:hypothetical protein